MSILGYLIQRKMRQELTILQHSNCLTIMQKQMTNSNQLDFYEPTLQQVADLCSQFGFTCAGEADLACLRAVLREGFSRWGRPAPAPDDRGVLPMIVSETGADDEPELERIICASISGGADYVNSMPRELRLERITPEGSTFARYIQVDADARPDVRPAPAPAGEVAELVASLRDAAASNERIGATQAAVQLTRAADLLEMCFSAKIAHDGSGNNE